MGWARHLEGNGVETHAGPSYSTFMNIRMTLGSSQSWCTNYQTNSSAWSSFPTAVLAGVMGVNLSRGKIWCSSWLERKLGNILKIARHETALTWGPLRNKALENLLKALRMYSELLIEPSEFFWTLHTKAQTLIASNVLQCASVSVGHEGTILSTNFVRKLLTSGLWGKCGLSCAECGYR